jgi:peptide/nickel transport system permease protein
MTDIAVPAGDSTALRRPRSSSRLARLTRSRTAMLGLVTVVVIALLSAGAPVISPYDPLVVHKGQQFTPPGSEFLFGTDEFGRDLLSRTLYGGRTSLVAGLLAVTIATLLGVPLGLIGGYFGRWVDAAVMRLIDMVLAFPAILLAMAVVAVLGPGSGSATIAVAVVSIPAFARLARAAMLSQKGMDYVTATRAVGARDTYVIFRAILPNTLPPILVQMALAVGSAILLEAALGFLGLGTQPPTPSWGSMLYTARSHLYRAPWYGVFPGVFITALILGLNTLAEGVRDVIDPSQRL